MKRHALTLIALIVGVSAHALATTPKQAPKHGPTEAGAQLVLEKQCLSCHKPYSALNTPRLHGSDKTYIMNQLKAFKSGKRTNVFMRGIVQQLTDKDMEQLAAYFSRFNVCDVTLAEAVGPGDVARGKMKAVSCLACHTAGSHTGAPVLDGQNGYYLASQLRDVKYGRRQNPLMSGIVQGLTEEDIIDISAYFSSLNNCAPVVKNVKVKKTPVRWHIPTPLLEKLTSDAKKRGWTVDEYVYFALDQYLTWQRSLR